MKKVLSVFLVLGLLLNCAFAGNIPTIQSKNYKQKQKVISLYEQIHEFLLYQYTIANDQNKIIIKKILNLPIEKLTIKAFPFENKISFFDKDKENFISFENQSDLIKKIIGKDKIETIISNRPLSPVAKQAIIIGVIVKVIGDLITRIVTHAMQVCYEHTCKIVKTWQTSTVIGHSPSNNAHNPTEHWGSFKGL